MSARSEKKNKTVLAVLAAILLGVLLFAVALEVGRAREEKSGYITASERLALLDLADAVNEIEIAAEQGDIMRVNRAAGKAEAYLSRAGLGDCGEVYRVIGGICSGEYGSDVCKSLSDAVKKAVDGDGGEALRKLNAPDEESGEESADETTEDKLSARVLDRLGRSGDDLALKRATSFACPNAVFWPCPSEGCGRNCFKYSGDNVFVTVGGESSRVMMYCFDRDVDSRLFITEDEAEQNVRFLIEREKLRLNGEPRAILEDGVYKFDFKESDDSEKTLVTVEIYSDTGRLRKYDAVNYYEMKK